MDEKSTVENLISVSDLKLGGCNYMSINGSLNVSITVVRPRRLRLSNSRRFID